MTKAKSESRPKAPIDASLNAIIIYTDGACSGNPGPGGWGAIVLTPDGMVEELGGRDSSTTNNKMELTAAIEALKRVGRSTDPVVIYTDSTYVIRGITQWVWNWRRDGWKAGEERGVQNLDLWKDLFRLVSARKDSKIQWKYVRGHMGVPGNERADQISVKFSKRQIPPLFSGPVETYVFDPGKLPPDSPLPDMKKPSGPKTTYSYLSLVDGVAIRHKDWPSCEKRVKGRSGAKFKKAATAEQDSEILASWGVKSAEES